MTESPKNDRFEPDATFWSTWGGRIVRAVVLHDAYTKDSIIKATSLKQEEFAQGFKGLIEGKHIEEKENGKVWVSPELYGKCKFFFEVVQKKLVCWVEEWRKKEGIEHRWGSNLDHFYLAGRLLPEFAESLIKKATEEILVQVPTLSDAIFAIH